MKIKQINQVGRLVGIIVLILITWYGLWSYNYRFFIGNKEFVGIISLLILLICTSVTVWIFKSWRASKKSTGILFAICLFMSFNIWIELPWEKWIPFDWMVIKEELALVLQEENNPSSLGHEIWFDSLLIDGESVVLNDWIKCDGWFKVDSGYSPHDVTNAVLRLNPIKGQKVTFNFLTTPYSGKVSFYRNDKFVEEFDLYSEEQGGLHYLTLPEVGMVQISVKFAMLLLIGWLNALVFLGGYHLVGTCFAKRQTIHAFGIKVIKQTEQVGRETLKITIVMIGRYQKFLINGALIYGFLTLFENLTSFSLGITLLLTFLLLLITKRIKCFVSLPLINSTIRIKRCIPFISIIFYLGLRKNQFWILHPIDELIRPYDLSITATGEKSLESMGAEVWISNIYVNGEAVTLDQFTESGEWILQGDAIVNAKLPAVLTLSSLQGEEVVVEFVKSAYSGNVTVSRSSSFLKEIDLHRPLSTYVQYKVTPDYFVLLGIAKFIIWVWMAWVLGAFYCVLIFLAQKIKLKKTYSIKTNQWISKLCAYPKKRQAQTIASACSQQRAAIQSLFHSGWGIFYLLLPFVLIFAFRYLGNWKFQSEMIGYFSFFMGAVVLEKICYHFVQHESKCPKTEGIVKGCKILFYSIWWSLLLMLLLGLIYHMPHMDIAWFWMETKVEAIIMVVTLLLSLIGVGYALLNHLPLTLGTLFLTFTCLGIGDYFKRMVAGEPLYPADLSMITKLDTLLGFLNGVSPVAVFVLLGSCIVGLIILTLLIRGPKVALKTRLCLFVVTGIYAFAFFNYGTSFLKTYVKGTTYIETWNQIQNYDDNGVIIGFVSNLQNDSMIKPENYSRGTIESIVEKYTKILNSIKEESVVERPNIVVIISESLSDPLIMSQLSFSEDPIPTIREYQTKGISGYFLSPFKGGSTSNVEFEFLTSLTNIFLTKGSVPFQQRLSTSKEFPSVVSYLNQLGYTSVAIHPSNPSFYKRNKVYPNLGFERFIGIDEMTYTERVSNQSFISDKSMMNELLEVLKAETTPTFAYGLTIQNHLPLEENKFGPTTIEVVDSTGERVTEMETYAQGIKLSDESLNYFLSELESFEEPTVVIFFGDHLINFESTIHQNHGYSYTEKNGDLAKLFFQTPLLIWANADVLLPQLVTSISPNFLIPLTLQALDFPLTPYYQLLLEIYEEFGALHRNFKLDREEHNITTLTESQELLLEEYELIQYDLMQGKGYALEKMFLPVQPE